MPLLIALGASVVLMRHTAHGPRHRELALEDLYTGYRQNVMAPDEVLAWIKVPPLPTAPVPPKSPTPLACRNAWPDKVPNARKTTSPPWPGAAPELAQGRAPRIYRRRRRGRHPRHAPAAPKPRCKASPGRDTIRVARQAAAPSSIHSPTCAPSADYPPNRADQSAEACLAGKQRRW